MENLDRELKELKRRFEGENEPGRRAALLEQIRATESAILNRMHAESARLAAESANMEAALEAIRRKEK